MGESTTITQEHSTNLPTDVASLHAIIFELQNENKKLLHMLLQMRRRMFGKKSEQLADGQAVLPFEGLSVADLPGSGGDNKGDEASADAGRKKPKGHGRTIIHGDLPEEERIYDVPEKDRRCECCKEELQSMGEDISRQLEYNPGLFFIIKHRVRKYACRSCRGNVVTGKKPGQPIAKGVPGPGLLSYVVVSKYADHLPLYRQEEIFKRSGVEIGRSTLCDWVKAAANLVEPIYRTMKEEVLQSRKIHTDDTVVRVQDREREGATRQGRLWVYVGDEEHPYTAYPALFMNREKEQREFSFRKFLSVL